MKHGQIKNPNAGHQRRNDRPHEVGVQALVEHEKDRHADKCHCHHAANGELQNDGSAAMLLHADLAEAVRRSVRHPNLHAGQSARTDWAEHGLRRRPTQAKRARTRAHKRRESTVLWSRLCGTPTSQRHANTAQTSATHMQTWRPEQSTLREIRIFVGFDFFFFFAKKFSTKKRQHQAAKLTPTNGNEKQQRVAQRQLNASPWAVEPIGSRFIGHEKRKQNKVEKPNGFRKEIFVEFF